MDLDQLKQDFLFLLDMCKSPENVFSKESKEFQLTQKWLNHLSMYSSDESNEMRVVNKFMSHLCAALVEGKLYGPFLMDPPKGKLENIDFNEIKHADASAAEVIPEQSNIRSVSLPLPELLTPLHDSFVLANQDATLSESLNSIPLKPDNDSSYQIKTGNAPFSNVYESQGHVAVGSTNLYFHVLTGGNQKSSSCNCPPKPCQCTENGGTCTCNRSRAGADKPPQTVTYDPADEKPICGYLMNELNLTPEFLMKFDDTLTSFIDFCKISTSQKIKKDATKTNGRKKFVPSTTRLNTQENLSKSTSLRQFELAEDICELLEAISAELRGATEPGASDYLERELIRYNNFLMSNSNMAEHLTTSSTSQVSWRSTRLLGLQNDLVKLLCDLMPGIKSSTLQ